VVIVPEKHTERQGQEATLKTWKTYLDFLVLTKFWNFLYVLLDNIERRY